jgi:hypothetical protein
MTKLLFSIKSPLSLKIRTKKGIINVKMSNVECKSSVHLAL